MGGIYFYFLGGFGFGASQILDRDGRVFDFQRYISRRIQFWNMFVHLRRSLLFKFQRPCNSFLFFFVLNDAGKVQAQKVVDSNQMTQAMLHYPCGFQASRSKLRDVAVVKPKGVGVLTSETSENLRLSWQEIWNHMYRPRIDPVWKKPSQLGQKGALS